MEALLVEVECLESGYLTVSINANPITIRNLLDTMKEKKKENKY